LSTDYEAVENTDYDWWKSDVAERIQMTKNRIAKDDIPTHKWFISILTYEKTTLEQAQELFDIVKNYGPLPSIIYTHMIYLFGNSGKLDEALNIFTMMRRDGVKHDENTYTTVMNAFFQAGKFDKVVEVIEGMIRDATARPQRSAFLMAMVACKHLNNQEKLTQITQSFENEQYESLSKDELAAVTI